MFSKGFVERFWVKVDMRGFFDCWNWQACRYGPMGYGRINIRVGQSVDAHRAAYQLVRGSIPPGLCVMHTCDNPACCNPYHLKLGTRGDNNQDRHLKDRDARGRSMDAVS